MVGHMIVSASTEVSFVDHVTRWKLTAFLANATRLSPPPHPPPPLPSYFEERPKIKADVTFVLIVSFSHLLQSNVSVPLFFP